MAFLYFFGAFYVFHSFDFTRVLLNLQAKCHLCPSYFVPDREFSLQNWIITSFPNKKTCRQILTHFVIRLINLRSVHSDLFIMTGVVDFCLQLASHRLTV